jgi:ubiquitin carboxyl-terminal hydrolase 22/27/51
MGQTCFMSVILQSLIHNPLLRSWYLSEGHKSSECEREACTACALDDIFTDFYGQEKHEGYGAVHMLQGCWKGGGNLAGYSQQDAHEYLGFILNSLHTALTEDEDDEPDTKKKKEDTKDCDCVIHQSFSGLLRSTVTCSKCKNVTTAIEPFLDLSLDIRSTAVSVKKKKLSMINGTTTVKEVLPMDLYECLDRFTSIETLSSDSYHCRKCDADQEAKKKLSLSRLPPVVPVHLKRFSHSKANSQSTKVDTKIRFPLTLDFSPYLTHKKRKSKLELTNGHKPDTEAQKDSPDPSGPAYPTEPLYELSSVIVHKGKIDNGHYVSYSRQGENEWFRFDDSMVVQVDEKEVLGAEAYMLVYVAQGFEV